MQPLGEQEAAERVRWILGRKYELSDEQLTLGAAELCDSDAIVTMTDNTGITYRGGPVAAAVGLQSQWSPSPGSNLAYQRRWVLGTSVTLRPTEVPQLRSSPRSRRQSSEQSQSQQGQARFHCIRQRHGTSHRAALE